MKGACVYGVPEVNGEDSKLFIGLRDNLQPSDLTTYIYSLYKANPSIATAMTNAGYRVNEQGEHNSADVMKFLDVNSIISERNVTLTVESQRYGIKNSSGKYVDFDSAEDAYRIAKQFNDNHKWRTARVVNNADKYNVIVSEVSEQSASIRSRVNFEYDLYNRIKAEFQAISKNLEDFNFTDLIHPQNIGDFVTYLSNLRNVAINTMSARDIQTLLTIDKGNSKVDNLINKYGITIEDAASKIWDILHDDSISATTKKNISNTLSQAKGALNIVPALDTAIVDATEARDASLEQTVANTIEELNTKFSLNQKIIEQKSQEIKSDKDAVISGLFSLNRQLEILKRRKGSKETAKDLDRKIQRVTDAISEGRYTAGILEVLEQIVNQSGKINSLAPNVTNITTAQQAWDALKITKRLINFRDNYESLVTALSNIDKLTIESNITAEQKELIKNQALDVRNIIDRQAINIRSLQQHCASLVYQELLGTDNINGKAIAEVLAMHSADATLQDRIFSMGRLSNPLLSGIGKIILDAQAERNNRMNELSTRITKADYRFRHNGGKNTSFMYMPVRNKKGELKGWRIISDRDWEAYNKDYYKQKNKLIRGGYKGYSLYVAMQDWIEANTDEMVVDTTNGRTERVPTAKKYLLVGDNNPLNKLNAAQKEYYNTVMQIKGEIGSLLPEYAQRQFLPTQRRKSNKEIIAERAKGMLTTKEAKQLLIENNKFKIYEDDTRFNRNGIVVTSEDEVLVKNDGAFDGTPLRRIPIFFINRLDNPLSILRDFSGSLQELASTACNYAAMDDIVDVVESLADYLVSTGKTAKNKEGESMTAAITRDSVTYLQRLKKRVGDSTAFDEILEGMITMQIYGQKVADSEKIVKYLQPLLSYTSVTGLAANFKGGLANYLVGEAQMLIEAGAREYYGIQDYLWAHGRIFGDKVGLGEFSDLFSQGKTSMVALLIEEFDPWQENYQDKSSKRYHDTALGRILGSSDIMFLYSSGEKIIHLVNMYATLHYERVLLDGKEIPLIEAFEKTNKEDGTCELKIKDGVRRLNGKEIDKDYLKSIKDNIQTVNQKCHGSMNTEDKGTATRFMIVRMFMQYRQWMVEHVSRRYRDAHFEANAGNVLDRNLFNKRVKVDGEIKKLRDAFDKYEHADGSFTLRLKDNVTDLKGNSITDKTYEDWVKKLNADHHSLSGFTSDALKFIFNLKDNWKKQEDRANIFQRIGEVWNNKEGKYSDREIYNLRRQCSELGLIVSLFGLSWALGMPEDHKKQYWYRMWIYQTRKVLKDEIAFTPLGMVGEFWGLIQNPLPCTKVLYGLLYPIIGITNGDVTQTLGNRSDYAGWNKYVRNVMKYTVPFWWHIQQALRFAEDDKQFNYLLGFDFDAMGARANK